jgi:hypothetical protein
LRSTSTTWKDAIATVVSLVATFVAHTASVARIHGAAYGVRRSIVEVIPLGARQSLGGL